MKQKKNNFEKKRVFIGFLRKTGLIKTFNALNNFRFSIVKQVYRISGKCALEAVYDDSIFKELEFVDSETNTSKTLVKVVKENFKANSVVDVGCGTGFYLSELSKHGIVGLGLDGSPAAIRNASFDNIKLQDVTLPFSLDRTFDLAMCFEVAEHIPKKSSEALVKNLTKLSNNVIFTAAPPGQGGTDHINEQHPKFWISIFERNGFSFDSGLTEKIKAALKNEGSVFWLADNIMVFKNDEVDSNGK